MRDGKLVRQGGVGAGEGGDGKMVWGQKGDTQRGRGGRAGNRERVPGFHACLLLPPAPCHHFPVSGDLQVTGQNPQSSTKTAELVVEALQL